MTPGTATGKLDVTAIFRSRGPKRPRRTAAGIMFADMAGFSVLMQADERAALEARAAYRAAMEEAVDEAGDIVVLDLAPGWLVVTPPGPGLIRSRRNPPPETGAP